MSRKRRKGYYVDGRWVADDGGAHSPADSLDEAAVPSRTARKNASRELQEIGERLLALKPEQLDELPLPDTLRDAIAQAHRISAFGARRRQLQFIGKLMRHLEPEVLKTVRAAVGTAGKPSP